MKIKIFILIVIVSFGSFTLYNRILEIKKQKANELVNELQRNGKKC